MKFNKMFFFVILSIIAQRLIINIYLPESNIFSFLNGIPFGTNFKYLNTYMLSWIIFILSTLSYFSGNLTKLLNGYGKLLIIRNYSKTKLILCEISKLYLMLFLFIIIQFFVFWNPNISFYSNDMYSILLMSLLYFFTVIILILIQFFLELFISAEISTICIYIYTVFSVIFYNIIYINNPNLNLFYYILIPNLAMSYRNGLIDNNFNLVNLIVLILYQFLLILFSIIKIRKTELF